MRRTVVLALLLLPTAAVLDPTASASSTETRVTVTMSERACRVAPAVVVEGPVRFAVVNRGRRARFFTIAGRRTPLVGPRRTRSLTATLDRQGRYAFRCVAPGRPRLVGRGLLRAMRQHRIGVRVVDGNGEFYDRLTGSRFTPRGTVYSRRGHYVHGYGGIREGDVTFDLGRYDASRAEAALAEMEALGYTVVKVFLNGQCASGCFVGDAGGAAPAYLANVADFLRRAQSHRLYVILTVDASAAGGIYARAVNRDCHLAVPGTIHGPNCEYLTQGGVDSDSFFWRDVALGLADQGAPLDVVLAYQLRDAAALTTFYAPLNGGSPPVTTANGETYVPSDLADRPRMIEDALVHWADRVRSAVLAVDPTALVGMGFWQPLDTPRRAEDWRIVETRGVIARSSLDYVDLAEAGRESGDLAEQFRLYGIAANPAKPFLMGGLAVHRSVPTSHEAGLVAAGRQAGSCAYGIDGWIQWTWDTFDLAWPIWHARSGDGGLGTLLSPRQRPDPCAP